MLILDDDEVLASDSMLIQYNEPVKPANTTLIPTEDRISQIRRRKVREC
jgi:hypothetical protein